MNIDTLHYIMGGKSLGLDQHNFYQDESSHRQILPFNHIAHIITQSPELRWT